MRRTQPKLIWLSVSHIVDEERFNAHYHDFYEQVRPMAQSSWGDEPSLPNSALLWRNRFVLQKAQQFGVVFRALRENPARRKTAYSPCGLQSGRFALAIIPHAVTIGASAYTSFSRSQAPDRSKSPIVNSNVGWETSITIWPDLKRD